MRNLDPASLDAAALLEAATAATNRSVRAWILRLLRWGAGASNSETLTGLLETIGLRLPRATVEIQGQWLAARGYVRIKQFEHVSVYELTRLGDEVGRGVVVDPEVTPIRLADVEDDEAVLAAVRAPPRPFG
ncbi:hypothetical protein [Caulobacter segnis]|uniref:ArsR family transcriptional regulator n=1 Tax=Caulobacter segnis TaxID=88688 RepID=A0A2W5V2Y0_9CAUL|nr:hypothetical protein [Caulobacter segnis]PZR31076.1 MAG: hypothetical protein DI526_20675 [Caulobacter segnis]